MASSSVRAASRAATLAAERSFAAPAVGCRAATPIGCRWPQRAPAQYAPKTITTAARIKRVILEVRRAGMVESPSLKCEEHYRENRGPVLGGGSLSRSCAEGASQRIESGSQTAP